MSDTPRTEAEVNRQKCWSDDLVTIDANFACQLERELNAANESFRKLNIHTLDLAARIKRLEEELDRFTCVVELTPMKWSRSLQEAFDMARAVLKSKEAKP